MLLSRQDPQEGEQSPIICSQARGPGNPTPLPPFSPCCEACQGTYTTREKPPEVWAWPPRLCAGNDLDLLPPTWCSGETKAQRHRQPKVRGHQGQPARPRLSLAPKPGKNDVVPRSGGGCLFCFDFFFFLKPEPNQLFKMLLQDGTPLADGLKRQIQAASPRIPAEPLAGSPTRRAAPARLRPARLAGVAGRCVPSTPFVEKWSQKVEFLAVFSLLREVRHLDAEEAICQDFMLSHAFR